MSDDQQPWDLVRRRLVGPGPVSPAVQMRTFLAYARDRGWEFDFAWRWSMERIKFPHDTEHRRDWREILGETPDDPRRQPSREREVWRTAYERSTPSRRSELAPGRLIAA